VAYYQGTVAGAGLRLGRPEVAITEVGNFLSACVQAAKEPDLCFVDVMVA
jgi:hypothetical protein